MTNRVVSTARLLPAGVQGACTFIMGRHLFVVRRLIDQFLTPVVALFKGRIPGIAWRGRKVPAH